MKPCRRTLPLSFAIISFCAVFFVPPAAALSISVSGGASAQGAPLLVEVTASGPVDNVTLTWKGTAFPMRETAPGRYEAVIGVDLLAAAGPETLAAEIVAGGVRTRAEKSLDVVERAFPVQKLTLPKGMAEFDAPTLKRIAAEKKALDERLARVTLPVMWSLPFIPPVEGYRPENFGSRRVINEEPRLPHTGVDIRLPEGTPVRAIADGVVALAAEQFFGGRSVVIDHGGAVFSFYYHLQRYSVEEGRRVSRGEPIGAVGATGRATGPHLHFGVRVPGGRVDPSLLFALPGKETAK
ncbi:MAG: M23 family metallopeptidase [Deltaproteobacteria bacterium]|nr:M23 family metallopeptidase [Deltaproteobacteria bacterium]